MRFVKPHQRRWQWTGSLDPPPTVHVRRLYWTKRRLLLWVAYTFIIYKATGYAFAKLGEALGDLVEDDESDDAAERSAELPQREVDEDGNVLLGDDEDALFIPFQFPQELPRLSYRGSDPEWQEFVKLGKDKQRQQEIKKELCAKVQEAVTKHPLARARLGKDIKVTRSWVDCIFPNEKPPQYSRYGLAFVTEGIAWSEQIIPHSEYVRMRHIIYPKAFVSAISEMVSVYALIKKVKLKTAMGFSLSRQEQALQQRLAILHMVAQKAKDDAQSGLPDGSNPGSEGNLQREANQQLGTSLASDSPSAATDPWRLPLSMIASGLAVMPKISVGADLGLASRSGMSKFAQEYQETKMDNMPPGACFYIGSVEVSGSSGRFKVNTVAAYDPKERKFEWVKSKPVHFWETHQRPRGGH